MHILIVIREVILLVCTCTETWRYWARSPLLPTSHMTVDPGMYCFSSSLSHTWALINVSYRDTTIHNCTHCTPAKIRHDKFVHLYHLPFYWYHRPRVQCGLLCSRVGWHCGTFPGPPYPISQSEEWRHSDAPPGSSKHLKGHRTKWDHWCFYESFNFLQTEISVLF